MPRRSAGLNHEGWKVLFKKHSETDRLGEKTGFPRKMIIAGKDIPTASVLNAYVEGFECLDDPEEVCCCVLHAQMPIHPVLDP
jgi:hypothetical protein